MTAVARELRRRNIPFDKDKRRIRQALVSALGSQLTLVADAFPILSIYHARR